MQLCFLALICFSFLNVFLMKVSLKRFLFVSLLLSSSLVFGQSSNDYRSQVDQWHHEREENLKKENGWLNLVGLYWLKPGKNTFGSGATNDIVFPKGTIPASAGYFELGVDNSVTVVPEPGIAVKVNNAAVSNRIIFHKDSARTPVVSYEGLRWTVIRRDDKIGIRLRDLQSATLASFKGIDRYPVSPEWKVDASLAKEGVPDRISITNVLGQTNLQKSAGKLSFTINGKKYSLDALDEGGPDLFVIFADATNTEETYPSGRFLAVKRPDHEGNTFIDFNRAYNPPCAFTDFATCPLPPPQNRLTLAIPAGEKKYGNH
jgi:uncharacterized protein (DUF1684 family)